ncbi:ParB N-terminal domain-containing protein [bacterium]|nr:ParB N-terminal domain-containing protein [bacterium]
MKPVSILDIYPDPAQPRRAIPRSVLVRLDYAPHPHDIGEFLKQWLQEEGIEARSILEGDDDAQVDVDAQTSPSLAALMSIVSLAGQIFASGLLNPVSLVRQAGDHYVIETGERRWMAYHLLHVLGFEGYAGIPARVMPERDPFRQAGENNARQNLNAIARARQYAILMMALHPDMRLLPYDQCPSDRAYYAQALNLRVPYGQAARFMDALGVKSRSSISEYRRLLELDDETWDFSDELNISIRQLLGRGDELYGAPNNLPPPDNPGIPNEPDRPTRPAEKRHMDEQEKALFASFKNPVAKLMGIWQREDPRQRSSDVRELIKAARDALSDMEAQLSE